VGAPSRSPTLSARGLTFKDVWFALVLIVLGGALITSYALASHERAAVSKEIQR